MKASPPKNTVAANRQLLQSIASSMTQGQFESTGTGNTPPLEDDTFESVRRRHLVDILDRAIDILDEVASDHDVASNDGYQPMLFPRRDDQPPDDSTAA